eukprot:CAMPEP_0206423136 /NCGR_PEP_ID=MMETSP0324_2-20121206/2510_1 /ASSEMBLY_ACC=CAM_ASM_000836 /TAXON_ID=2866 /ORGANISM="Crypthecodinium cohnii, Strain Seligo" /LENGTH=77 /DNA_ID=CAMNT_0053887657 /DNA_START=500 /DNA_END=733 /DNA_ORIENTATION=-
MASRAKLLNLPFNSIAMPASMRVKVTSCDAVPRHRLQAPGAGGAESDTKMFPGCKSPWMKPLTKIILAAERRRCDFP